MTLIKILVALLLLLFTSPSASAQRLLWPGDAGYNGPRSCGLLDAACVTEKSAQRPTARPTKEARQAKRKRTIKKVARPNPAIKQWEQQGQPAPISERLKKEAELPPKAAEKLAPAPAPREFSVPKPEAPKPAPLATAPRSGAGPLAFAILAVLALIGLGIWSRRVRKTIAVPRPTEDDDRMVVIKPVPPPIPA